MRPGLIAALLGLILLLSAAARADAPAAQIDMGGSAIVMGASPNPVARLVGRDVARPFTLRLSVSRPIPYRVFLLDGPPRLVVDLDGLDLGGHPASTLFGADHLPGFRWGRMRNGWTRIVAELPGPYRVDRASLRAAAARPLIEIALEPVAPEAFAPRIGAAGDALRDLPAPADTPEPPPDDRRLRVVLDPGHGGIDPGAISDGQTEADLVLEFAQGLASALRARGIDVSLTREDDSFVGLEARMTAARQAGADLFVSLHADALPVGQAAGAAVYIWSGTDDDSAARQLALRHDRDDLLSGIDLGGRDDALATALMGVARTDTQPRSKNFAKFLTSRMALEGIVMHRRPVQGARFSVLKAPDFPSVLLELGFLTDSGDRARLTDPGWRARMTRTIADAIAAWANDDSARRALLRR
ncbi:N-acetylmuramoyl-L-alanine amidase [Paracoccus sp. TK19116]|uniref:N-acetylmuramoyl-L-alanine amidase n=1 Tax=Paracoccus albicereus TaxID=2922394 RepID=A0ABT1MRB2_9RHOB|nr:N-acetylmuramoyl-L-alanine amidase [Paracoccus albicereus]MCQ0969873.1 N-acetylmuramoyl-L-alanine amidase [Paracoccus albicereus]